MASFDYNPITGQLDLVGSGGGSYIDGEVEYHSNLPVTVGTPAVNSAFLVRKGEGLYFISRKPAGIWVRELNNGNLDDWKFAGLFSDLYRDANFRIISDSDVTKEIAFSAASIATGTTRTITVPNKNVTLDDAGDSRTPTAHAASHASAGSDPVSISSSQVTDATSDNTPSTIVKRSSGGVVNVGTLNCDLFATPEVAGSSLSFDASGINFDGAAISNTRANLGLGTSATADIGTGSTEVAAGDHGHGNLTSDGKLGSTAGLPVVTTTAGAVTTLALGTANQVLRVNSGATGVEFADASGGGVTAVGASTADVLSVSGSNLVADDGGTIDSADPFIKWDDAAGKLVYANPLSRPSGAMYVGIAPTTTALGTEALCLQATRSNAICVPSGTGAIAIGRGARATGTNSIAIGASTSRADSLSDNTVVIGANSSANNTNSVAIGNTATANVTNGTAIGFESTAIRGGFATRPFASAYWSGQTTNNTATILNIDGTATNRFTIAASTAMAVDILLVARRSDTQDKWLVARRFLGIRRDGSNNTSLIGTVQEVAPDQSAGSPTWTYSLTADTTNHALQLEVVGANSETVQWRATAFYRVV